MAYLSPERVAARSYKYPADIWSLGMSLVYCATCLPPTTENGVDYWKIANTVHNLSCSQSTPCDSFLGTPHSVGCSPSSRAASDVQSPMSKSPREITAPSFVPFTISAKYHSAELRSFLSACLVIDPDQRATAVELLNHPFILKYSCPSKKSSTNPLVTRPDSSVVENLFEILLSRNEQSNLSPTNLQHLSNMGIDWSMDSSFADTSKSAKAIASAAALDDIDSFAVPVLEENASDNYESQHFTSSANVLGTYELDDIRLRYLGDQFAISADEVRRRLFEFQRR
jgi:serine/threonine protein kinase